MVVLALTQNGRKRAREVTNARGTDSTFLASLIENGPSSIEDLAIDLHVPQSHVQRIAGKLSRQGLIRREE